MQEAPLYRFSTVTSHSHLHFFPPNLFSVPFPSLSHRQTSLTLSAVARESEILDLFLGCDSYRRQLRYGEMGEGIDGEWKERAEEESALRIRILLRNFTCFIRTCILSYALVL